MPKKLQKTLQDYLNKIKNKNPQPQIRLTKMLSGCKHPKTPSFSLDDGRNISSSNAVNNNNNKINDAATLADVDRFLFENFKSLYFKDDDETDQNNNNNNKNKRISDGKNNEEPPKRVGGSWLLESPRFITTPPPQDLCGSTRFFVKPGNSGSLMEDALSLTNSDDEADSSNSNSSSTEESPSKEVVVVNHDYHNNTLPENCVALLSYSPSPYDDFRRSMQELVESKYGKIENNQRKIDWDFMEEILFCYLNVNDKKSHKFILSAFVDLITVMRKNSEAAPAKPCSVRTVRIGREVRKKKTKQVTIEFGSS